MLRFLHLSSWPLLASSFGGSIVIAALTFGFFAACTGEKQPCGTDYNCPTGQLCFAGECKAFTPEPKAEAIPEAGPEEVTPEPPPEPLPEPKPEPLPEPGPCQKSEDCKAPTHTVCYSGQCVPGFLEFDFSKGHPIVDPDAAPKTCTANAQCAAWQSCSSGRCVFQVSTSSKTTGKIGPNGVFLSGYSLSALLTEKGETFLQIIMVGTLSDKFQQHLIIDIPLALVKTGPISIAPSQARATFYDVYIEFSPVRELTAASAIQGEVVLTTAGSTLGGRVAGVAKLIFKPVP